MKKIILPNIITIIFLTSFSCSDSSNLERTNLKEAPLGEDSSEEDKTVNTESKDILSNSEDGTFVEDFVAEFASDPKTVDLTWNWGKRKNDVEHFKIVSQEGDSVDSCSDDNIFFESTVVKRESYSDTVESQSDYSFRFCIYGAKQKLLSEEVVATAKQTVSKCDGESVGGFCWYAMRTGPGSKSLVCSEVCENHGGYDHEGTMGFAGSGGTDENCKLVLEALGLGEPGGEVTQANDTYVQHASGCIAQEHRLQSKNRYRVTRPGFETQDDPGKKLYKLSRACACKS